MLNASLSLLSLRLIHRVKILVTFYSASVSQTGLHPTLIHQSQITFITKVSDFCASLANEKQVTTKTFLMAVHKATKKTSKPP